VFRWQGENQGEEELFGPPVGRKDMKDRRWQRKSLDAKLGRKGESNVGRAKLGRRKRNPDSDSDDADEFN
jgi:hypothetical protein